MASVKGRGPKAKPQYNPLLRLCVTHAMRIMRAEEGSKYYNEKHKFLLTKDLVGKAIGKQEPDQVHFHQHKNFYNSMLERAGILVDE